MNKVKIMKYIYCLVFIMVFGSKSNLLSQTAISVNQNDFANANTQVILSNASALSQTVAGLANTGANSIWNYSNLTPTSQDTLAFTAPSSTPYFLLNNAFVSTYANTGVFALPAIPNVPTISDVTDYYKKSSTDLRQVGVGITLSSIPIPTFYNPVDKLYKFPLNYNNVDSALAKFSISIPTLGYYGADINRKNIVDGWGSLTTPFGTFQTLRVKSEVKRIDSLKLDTLLPFGFSFPRPTLYEYKWIAKNLKYPVLQINTNLIAGAEVIVSIQYQDSLRLLGVGLNNFSANKTIQISKLEQGQYRLKRNQPLNRSEIYVFDISGKLLNQIRWNTETHDIQLPQENTQYIILVATDNDIKTFKVSR
jgi:hypothetical protein